MPPSQSSTRSWVREGRIVERRAIGDLRPGDLVQHYSTWEQTYGDPIRRVFVKWEHGPIRDDHKVVVTWNNPFDADQEDYEARYKLDEVVDLVVGTAEMAAIVENPFLGLTADQRQLVTCALAGNYPSELEHLRYDVIKMLARADLGKA